MGPNMKQFHQAIIEACARTDRLTDWTLSYMPWIHLGGAGNNWETFANSKVWSVLHIEWTKYMPNVPSFLELLKISASWVEQVPFLSIWDFILTQIPIYIGKGTACTFFCQLLILYNQNKIFMAAIKQRHVITLKGTVSLVQPFLTIIRFATNIDA